MSYSADYYKKTDHGIVGLHLQAFQVQEMSRANDINGARLDIEQSRYSHERERARKHPIGDNRSPVCVIKGRPPIKIYVDEDEVQFVMEKDEEVFAYNISILYKNKAKKRSLARVEWPCTLREEDMLYSDDIWFYLDAKAHPTMYAIESAFYEGVESLTHFYLNVEDIVKQSNPSMYFDYHPMINPQDIFVEILI